ncbi:MAG: hypothetical protein GX754_02140 [Clostridiaceae bacterium]|nr:hypothetical protein [Clostridiaceae bacterium]
MENKERLEAEIYPGNKAYQEEKVQDIVMENLRIMADDGSEEISDRRKDFSCNAEPYVVENVDRNGIIPLSNKLKVFLTVLSTIIPGFGQLLGIITAIAFMNSEDDPDRHSFGVALLVASLLMFVLVSLLCFVFILITSKVRH